MQELQVWGREPKGEKKIFLCSYILSRWQWAEKLKSFLKEKGFTNLEIKKVEVNNGKK